MRIRMLATAVAALSLLGACSTSLSDQDRASLATASRNSEEAKTQAAQAAEAARQAQASADRAAADARAANEKADRMFQRSMRK
jgi:hypothetical protein